MLNHARRLTVMTSDGPPATISAGICDSGQFSIDMISSFEHNANSKGRAWTKKTENWTFSHKVLFMNWRPLFQFVKWLNRDSDQKIFDHCMCQQLLKMDNFKNLFEPVNEGYRRINFRANNSVEFKPVNEGCRWCRAIRGSRDFQSLPEWRRASFRPLTSTLTEIIAWNEQENKTNLVPMKKIHLNFLILNLNSRIFLWMKEQF